jgi:threonylcarbamoyladenosine tRNA methylthiotransferase MtaB
MIDFVAKSRAFVPHFHIPLQSGNNEILKKMKRSYLNDLFNDRVNQIKTLMPDACIGADVIVGFPGESDDAFLDTYKFIADLDISYLHVFSYSERPGTEAEKMYDIVPKKIRSKRSKILRGLSVKKRRYFYEKQLGKKVKVLFEHENKKGYATGFSENYLKIRTPWNPRLGNSIHEVTLDDIDKEGFLRCQI